MLAMVSSWPIISTPTHSRPKVSAHLMLLVRPLWAMVWSVWDSKGPARAPFPPGHWGLVPASVCLGLSPPWLALPPFLHLETYSIDRVMEKHTRPTESACESCIGCRVGPISRSASGSVLDQTLPDSQTLRLDETVDSMGDDDPFTAKLSFEVRVPL